MPMGNIPVDDFIKYFPEASKNMKNLETVTLYFENSRCVPLCQYICENYEKHCMGDSFYCYI
jgi:hypothetical protein